MRRDKTLISAAAAAVLLLGLATGGTVAQQSPRPEPRPEPSTAADIVRELAAMRESLEAIGDLLGGALAHQEIGALMTRIQLKERRLEPLERELRGARNDLDGATEQLKRFALMKDDWERRVRERDSTQSEDPAMELEMRRLMRETEVLEARQATTQQKIIEMENDIARRRDDILTLEEMVDEALGLR